MAAGLTIDPGNLDTFRTRMNEIARSRIRPELLQPELRLDGFVELGDLSVSRMEELELMEPTGQGNSAIQLAVEGAYLADEPRRIGKENQHVKLVVTDGRVKVETLWWNAADRELPDGRFDLAFRPKINEFRGNRKPQLNLLDWRPSR